MSPLFIHAETKINCEIYIKREMDTAQSELGQFSYNNTEFIAALLLVSISYSIRTETEWGGGGLFQRYSVKPKNNIYCVLRVPLLGPPSCQSVDFVLVSKRSARLSRLLIHLTFSFNFQNPHGSVSAGP